MLLLSIAPALCAGSCSEQEVDGEGTGLLRIALQADPNVQIVSKSVDPATFTVDVLKAQQVVHSLSGADCSTALTLPVGDYTVKAYSAPFTSPAFDTPVYGASATASVAAGATASVSLQCVQSNAGVSVQYSDAFKATHTTYSTTVRQVEGALTYTESDVSTGRLGYFLPDVATVTITADGVNYEQQVNLSAQHNYAVEVGSSEPSRTETGALNVSITVSTVVTNDQIAVTFPSSTTTFNETMGATNVASQIAVSSYMGWSAHAATYSGTSMYVHSTASGSSGYSGASGGNYLIAKAAKAQFTMSGLTVSASAPAQFSFGCCFDDVYKVGDVSVQTSTDGGQTFTPLTLPEDAHALNSRWGQITVSLPTSDALCVRVISNRLGGRFDDFTIALQ